MREGGSEGGSVAFFFLLRLVRETVREAGREGFYFLVPLTSDAFFFVERGLLFFSFVPTASDA